MLLKSLKYFLATIFFLLSTVFALSDIVIVPKKKPNLNEENKQKNLSSNFIFPKQKPGSKKKEIKTTSEHKEIKITKINGVIIPKNKPLIVKKERLRQVKKSKYYSDRDLNYAKQAIAFMEKSNWKDAKKLQKKLELNRYMILFNGDI